MRIPKILVVDDECSFTRLLRQALSRYEIREVNDARRALETAREFKPDLILLDVIMPQMDGGDVAVQLRDDPVLKQVPVVFLTASISPKEIGHGSQLLGGYPILTKPLNAEDLIDFIEQNLARVT